MSEQNRFNVIFFKHIFKNARDKVLKGSVADRPVPLVPKRSTGKTTYMREGKITDLIKL